MTTTDTSAQGGSATTFLIDPSRDLEAMGRLGLGGAALVDDRLFAGAMAINLTTISRLAEAETIADETRICLESVGRTLSRIGCTLADIAKITCYVSEKAFIPEMWQTLDEIFAPGPYPKRVTLVAGIGGNCRVEFEVLAVLPDGSDEEVMP